MAENRAPVDPREEQLQPVRILFLTAVKSAILNAYVRPLLALEEVREVVIVRDQSDVDLGPKFRVRAAPRWWPITVPTKLAARRFLLGRTVRESPPDIMMTLHWFPDGPAVQRMAEHIGVPTVHHIIGGRAELVDGGRKMALAPLSTPLKRRAQAFHASLLNRATILSFTGEATRDWYRAAGMEGPALEVLHAAIDDASFFDRGATRDLDVAYVGRVDRDKRVDRLFEVLAVMGRARSGLRAHLVGVEHQQVKSWPSYRAAVAVMGSGLTLEARTLSVGNLFRRARLNLMTSDTEGRTLAVLEGMACGAVPVVTDVGDLREIVEGAGCCVSLGEEESTVNALARAALELLANVEQWRACSGNSAARVRKEHSVMRAQDDWRRILRLALAHRALS